MKRTRITTSNVAFNAPSIKNYKLVCTSNGIYTKFLEPKPLNLKIS